jgi:hypothetical protein
MFPNWPLTAACHFLAVTCDGETFDLQLPVTDGGDRTHTHLRELDFESSASANSATSAFVRRKLETRLPRNARGKELFQEFRSSIDSDRNESLETQNFS